MKGIGSNDFVRGSTRGTIVSRNQDRVRKRRDIGSIQVSDEGWVKYQRSLRD